MDATAADAFAGLEPAALWRHFAALTRIPRPSGREQQAVAYVREWARARGLERRAHARVFSAEPEVTAVHAGLECGLIGERVNIPSVARFWKLLGAVLEDLGD